MLSPWPRGECFWLHRRITIRRPNWIPFLTTPDWNEKCITYERSHRRYVQLLLHDLQTINLPNAGHFSARELPEEMARILLQSRATTNN